jgi:uncharacterized membrane protein
MLKENKKTLIITSIVTLLPIIIGVVLWKRLPDVMVTHFGMDSTGNGSSSKAFAVFVFPVILLALHLLVAYITAHDPKKQNISAKMFTLVLWIMPVLSVVLSAVIYSYNMGGKVDVILVSELLISLILIVAGNYMPKARQNYTIGIRLPWTLANEENWDRTHRMAGWIWMIGGIVMAALALCSVLAPVWMIVIFAVIVLIPLFYSLWLHVSKSL